jgi:hypothetical protein
LVHSLPALHATQAAPLSPQAALAVPGWQTPPASQQPLGQLAALHLHAPLTHAWPVAQATHAAPFTPQSAFVVPASQVVPLQQPGEQSVGSQYATHA